MWKLIQPRECTICTISTNYCIFPTPLYNFLNDHSDTHPSFFKTIYVIDQQLIHEVDLNFTKPYPFPKDEE